MSALHIYQAPDGHLVEQNGSLPRLLLPVCRMAGLPAGAVPVANTLDGEMFLLPDDDLAVQTRAGLQLLVAIARAEVTPDMEEIAVLDLEQDPWLGVGAAAPLSLGSAPCLPGCGVDCGSSHRLRDTVPHHTLHSRFCQRDGRVEKQREVVL